MERQEALDYIDRSYSDYFTYGIEGSDLGTPIDRISAMLDIMNMTDDEWNNGVILECDEDGQEI